MHNLHVSWEGGITFDSAAAAGTDGALLIGYEVSRNDFCARRPTC